MMEGGGGCGYTRLLGIASCHETDWLDYEG